MDKESEFTSDDFDFWLTACAILTFLCYALFGVLVFLLRRIINDAFRAVLRTNVFKPSTETVFPLTNCAAITQITHKENGGSLRLSLSLLKGVSMFLLRNVPLIDFHSAMIRPTVELLQFIRDTAVEEVSIYNRDIFVKTNQELVNINDFRRSYDLVFAFFDESALEGEIQDEQVVLSLYMIHVKQHKEERRPTQKLFTNGAENEDGEQNQRPDCAICLAEAAANVIFVPCRHVAMCQKCLLGFQASSQCLHCPLCRGVISEIKLL